MRCTLRCAVYCVLRYVLRCVLRCVLSRIIFDTLLLGLPFRLLCNLLRLCGSPVGHLCARAKLHEFLRFGMAHLVLQACELGEESGLSLPGTPLIRFENYYLNQPAHDRAFAAAGFAPPVERHHVSVSPEGYAAYPEGWWDEWLACRSNVFYRARAT